jgi:hypothetical protein
MEAMNMESAAPGQGTTRHVGPGTICKAQVWGSPGSRAVTVEVTSVVAAGDDGFEVWGYRLDRLRYRMGHMQHQRPRHCRVPFAWV